MTEAPPHGKRRGFLVRQAEPFNGGPPPTLLASAPITPADLFFVRNHGEVPVVDPSTFALRVEGAVERPRAYVLEDLARFPTVTLPATLQCAGNRRQELGELRPIPHELPWGAEAVGTAVWEGVRLADLLAEVGPTAEARHVACEGLDSTERLGRRFRYGGSIPIEKARAPEVLVAVAMNGAPLSPVHGYPLRLVVPGWIGARSVKWLERIVLQAEPSDNYFQAIAYRLFPSSVGPESVDWNEGAMLGELPVNSFFTHPEDGTRLAPGSVECAGIALAGGGRSVVRVEVSSDGGGRWTQADLSPAPSAWSWRPWTARIELPAGEHELVVRAWDSAAQTQPSTVAEVWNFKGYVNNAWHRVRLSLGGS